MEKNWQLTEKSYKISVRVSATIYGAMLSRVESGAYFNVQDYLKDIIKRDLMRRYTELEEFK